jgi:hypothetical protein
VVVLDSMLVQDSVLVHQDSTLPHLDHQVPALVVLMMPHSVLVEVLEVLVTNHIQATPDSVVLVSVQLHQLATHQQ